MRAGGEGGGPAAGGGVRRARAGAGDRGRARAGRGRLAGEHRVPRRLPRRPPRHRVVLDGHRQVRTIQFYLENHYNTLPGPLVGNQF